MAVKRRIIYEDEDDDDDDSGNNRGSSSNKRSRGASGETEIRPAEVPAAEPSGTRRSARSGKGNGGQLAQMKMLERIQTEQPKRPSRIDVALQGEQINPMAPSSQDARERGSHCRQVDSNSPDTISLQSHAPLRSPQPVFSLAAASQEFGFRLPDVASQAHMSAGTAAQTQAPPRARFRGVVSESSSKSVSSRSPSIFSTGPSRRGGTSTAPTSRTPSLCSTGEQMHLHSTQRRDDAGSASALPHSSFSQAASETSIPQMFRFEDFDEQSADPPLAWQIAPPDYNAPLPFMTCLSPSTRIVTALPQHLGSVKIEANYKYVSINPQTFIHQLAHPCDEIDEASPSEDDRFAEEMLRRPSPRQGDKGLSGASCELPGNLATATQEAEDIVAAHRKRLGDQGTPPITQVPAKSQEISSATETAIHGHGISDTDATKPVGPATEGAEPWQLQYYDPSARDIIDRAKQFSHCDAASINAFPVHSTFNAKTVDYIEEAIAERRTRHLHISEGWWPHHASGITRLLWEDLGNWRSGLRKKARSFVAQRYQWDPENRREQNIEIARRLLGNGGLFLKNGVDDEGHANNLAHPALAGLIIDFFYSGSTSVGQLFPEVFSPEVPRVAVAIAATALKVVLDEIVSGVGEVNFRVATYSPVYVEILGLMSKCDTSPIHQAKTRTLRIRWAELGSNGMAKQEPGVVSSGFDVDLT
ncbi:hypothetical protein EDD15DRAFT_2359402 [Pisolithus albus]|nr:hypothetical protein EDD15DRAFT_2359402 [Pisolithus albus]